MLIWTKSSRSESESVPAVVEEVTARAQPETVNPDMRYESVAAPTQSLPQNADKSQQFSSVSTAELKSLADPGNSPELAAAITQATGRSPINSPAATSSMASQRWKAKASQ